MKTIIIAAFVSLVAVGCGYHIPIAGEGYDGPTNPQPGQSIAVHIIWNSYGLADGTEPPILWHFNDNCIDYRGIGSGPKYGTPGAFMSARESDPKVCEYGQFETSGWVDTTEFDATNRVDIEWHGTFSDGQTLAHELCHAYNWYTGGDGDENHTSDCFVGTDKQPLSLGGDAHEGSLVYAANALLIAAGL